MKLVGIRHLPTVWNQLGKLQGHQDIPILEPDLSTLAEINKQYHDFELQKAEVVLVSRLQRTYQTALAYGFKSPTVEPLLDELDFAMFEGKSKKYMESVLGPMWFTSPSRTSLQPSLNALQNRLVSFLSRYRSRYAYTVIFGHGAWLRALLSFYEKGHIEDMNKIELKNNQLIVLEF